MIEKTLMKLIALLVNFSIAFFFWLGTISLLDAVFNGTLDEQIAGLKIVMVLLFLITYALSCSWVVLWLGKDLIKSVFKRNN